MDNLRYLALPSVESLEASNIYDRNLVHIHAHVPLMNTNIRSLFLNRCPTTTNAMFEMLGATKQLQSFSLYGTRMNNYMLKTSLLASAKDTLQSLRLRLDGIDGAQGVEQYLGAEQYLGTLRSFQALHTLEVDLDMLEMQSHGPCLRHLDAILPSSLRSLTIWYQGPSFDDLEEGFYRLLHADIGRAINLKQVVLSGLGKWEKRANLSHINELAIRFLHQGTYYHFVNNATRPYAASSRNATAVLVSCS